MYDTFLRDVETYFEEVRLLKRGARGSVTLLRHRSTGKRYIFRRFTGSAEVYRKLLRSPFCSRRVTRRCTPATGGTPSSSSPSATT